MGTEDEQDVTDPGRRKFVRNLVLLLGAASLPRSISGWVIRGGLARPNFEPSGIMAENVSVDGASLMEVDGNAYEVKIDKRSLVRVALKVAEIEGGNVLVEKVRTWLEGNQLNFYLSAGSSVLEFFRYPRVDLSYLSDQGRKDLLNKLGNRDDTKHFKPLDIETEGGTFMFKLGGFYPPSGTTDRKPAILLNNNVVYRIFYRKMSRLDGEFATRKIDLIERGVMGVGGEDTTLAHEVWHFVRWVNNPSREEELTGSDDGPSHPKDAVVEAAETGAAAVVGAALSRLSKETGLPERLFRIVLLGTGAKGIIDPIFEPYPRTNHPEKEQDRVEDAFENDPELAKMVFEVFNFNRIS